MHRMPSRLPTGIVDVIGAGSATLGTQTHIPAFGTIDFEARSSEGMFEYWMDFYFPDKGKAARYLCVLFVLLIIVALLCDL